MMVLSATTVGMGVASAVAGAVPQAAIVKASVTSVNSLMCFMFGFLFLLDAHLGVVSGLFTMGLKFGCKKQEEQFFQ
jgi:hypothetical protein